MGFMDLPLEVGTWVRPVHMALNKSQADRARQRQGAGGDE